ncbi:flagellar motor switch protein FliM [Kerstersia gyiorum]|uniref:Flagellar motor switch protein FliM n=1 Tax=Kerstersia gyiorum TaxID=206506 RepID=A0A171KRE4_9BURK|nr:flagellar motor switch protein FliM [Kerstersia gyiorum]KKO71461.1 flagellar motor switch protein FliM [Kerstersia gyiorum]
MGYEAFLSQDEVDALVAEVSGDTSAQDAAEQADAGAVRAYDLGSPDRIVRRRMQTLELINERFGRNIRSALLQFMRRSADVSVSSLRIMKYIDFERNLPVPSNLNMVAMRPLRGSALFVFDPSLVFLVVDSLFGGSGRYHTRVEGREFTLTEQRVIQRLLRLTLDCYGKSWEPVYPIDFEYIRSEMHTKFASITDSNEAVVVSAFRIEFGTVGGTLHICLPYSMIEPIRDLLTRPLQDASLDAADRRWTSLLAREVRQAEVTLAAQFGHIPLKLQDLLKLKIGDVLPLERPETVQASVNNVPVMECEYGRHNGSYALRVQQILAHPDLDSNEIDAL